MIFITVGTTPFPFKRMVSIVKQIILKRRNNETIIFQYGKAKTVEIKDKNVYLFNELTFDKTQTFIKKARIVVCHGGPATIFQCLKLGKKPIVFPRESRYREHVNDHQLHFYGFLLGKKLIYGKDMINSIDTIRDINKMINPTQPKNEIVVYLSKYD